MTNERRKRAEELFQAVLDLPPGAREGFLEKKCRSDATLRADVEALLHAHQAETPILLRPPGDPDKDGKA